MFEEYVKYKNFWIRSCFLFFPTVEIFQKMIDIDHKIYSYWTEKYNWLTINIKTIKMKKKNAKNKTEINLMKFQI